MLSTDTEAEEEGKTTPKVTLCTVHAAKGLEWPVVFIPAGSSSILVSLDRLSSTCSLVHQG
jgi:superfamily I DNA/RNA helicase